MNVAALVVAIVSALCAGYAVWFARKQARAADRSAVASERSAAAAEAAAALEASRRHGELTPRFRVTVDGANPGVDDLRLTVFLAGPPELERLDSLTVRIRDDYPGRAEQSRIAGGPSHEQVAAQIWGPYRFQPGTGPGGPGADETGRVTPTGGVPVGESLPFILTPTMRPPWSGADTFWWRKFQGTAVRLQLECAHADESWSLPCEVDVASMPVSVEVP
jgi:hypothetical protein